MMMKALNLFLIVLLSSSSLLASAWLLVTRSAIPSRMISTSRVSWMLLSSSKARTLLPLALLSPTTRLFMVNESSGEGGDIKRGTVKWFDTMKGFGFILPDDGSSDIFVHQTAIQTQGFRSLADGEIVEYKVATDAKTGRRKAVSVTGPGGVNVQGAPFRPASNDDDGY